MIEFYSSNQAAVYLGVTLASFRENVLPDLLQRGRYDRGGPDQGLRFDREALDAWIDSEKRRTEEREFSLRQRVYFIRPENGGPIKIGTTVSVDARLKSLQTAWPYKLLVLVDVPGDSALECELHARFAAHRMLGEWFQPAPELLAYIQELAREQV